LNYSPKIKPNRTPYGALKTITRSERTFSNELLRFFVFGMLAFVFAILVHDKTIGRLAFILRRRIISVLA